jgi:hypothetical protein
MLLPELEVTQVNTSPDYSILSQGLSLTGEDSMSLRSYTRICDFRPYVRSSLPWGDGSPVKIKRFLPHSLSTPVLTFLGGRKELKRNAVELQPPDS